MTDKPHTTVDRRRFIQSSLAASALFGTGALTSGVHGIVAPTRKGSLGLREDKLRIATIGCRNRAAANINGMRHENIVALCDVDSNFLGQAGADFPDAKQFEDFREMLEADLDLDCVIVSTPDHTHAAAAARALHHGKNVYCEKPLAHTVEEARRLGELALSPGIATQMGTQIHAGENYRRVVELIRSGAIGDVTEAHAWVGKSWSDGRIQAGDKPETLNWDLWLGPTATVPYAANVHPANWRKFWAWGNGTLGDMGCHYLDLLQWALELGAPIEVEAEGPPVNQVGAPNWCHATWRFPARKSMVPCTMHWWDSGRRPDVLKQLKFADGSQVEWGDGQLFIGTEGVLLSNYSRYLLLPEDKFVNFNAPKKWIPKSHGHYREFLSAARNGTPTTCNFPYAAQLTETVLLGTVAFRTGKPLSWDAAAGQTNDAAANAMLTDSVRDGWRI